MALDFYRKSLGINSQEELVKSFTESLVITNRTPDFFVDWPKVKMNVDEIRLELDLWDSLIKSKNIRADFKILIESHPQVLRTMPILLAIRDLKFPVIYDFPDRSTIKDYDFKKQKEDKLKVDEINKYLELAEKGGLFDVFSFVSSFYDYILGVEVGMDTNARKNRSGQIMENAIYPIVKNICSSKCIDFHFQEKFKIVGEKYNVKAPKDTPNRKPDFILQKGGKFVNIEVNFFNGSGSKPEEIIESYSNRRNKLLAAGWGFIFITDGNVWNKSLNQLKNGFDNIDYLLNLDFVKKGLLEAALKEEFSK